VVAGLKANFAFLPIRNITQQTNLVHRMFSCASLQLHVLASCFVRLLCFDFMLADVQFKTSLMDERTGIQFKTVYTVIGEPGSQAVKQYFHLIESLFVSFMSFSFVRESIRFSLVMF